MMKGIESQIQNNHEVQIKKPKRILYCSDGIYEEYSEDEQENKKNEGPKNENLSLLWKAARSITNTLDYLGESLGEFLGITTPKYSYEISHFQSAQEQRAKEEAYEKENSWHDVERNGNNEPVTQGPSKCNERF